MDKLLIKEEFETKSFWVFSSVASKDFLCLFTISTGLNFCQKKKKKKSNAYIKCWKNLSKATNEKKSQFSPLPKYKVYWQKARHEEQGKISK